MNVCDDLDRQYSAIQINVLSGDDPWTLFTQKAGDNLKVPPGFEEIGKKIVEECRGLPFMLTCSCGAISLMSNLPDGEIHYLETETVLLQDNNKLKLNSSRYGSSKLKVFTLIYWRSQSVLT